MKKWHVCRLVPLLLLLLLMAAPLHASAKKKLSPAKTPDPALVVHTHTAEENSFKASSYLLETPSRVILIDTQLTTYEAGKVKQKLDAIGKPLAAIFVTQPHPDNYNNIDLFQDAKSVVPVYATTATIAAIQEQDPKHRQYWSRFYLGNYPTKLTLPTHPVKAGDQLVIDGLTLQIDEVRGGEAASTMLIVLPDQKALFVGDLVYNGVHPNMQEGGTKQWLANLQTVSSRYPEVATIYPGHGASGPRELLATQAAYLTTVRSQIRSRLKLNDPRVPFDALSLQIVGNSLLKAYSYVGTLYLEISLDKVVDEMLQEAGYKPTVEDEEEE